jgi:hypothetical protein
MRMPVSLVRRTTENPITPNRPTEASINPITPKIAKKDEAIFSRGSQGRPHSVSPRSIEGVRGCGDGGNSRLREGRWFFVTGAGRGAERSRFNIIYLETMFKVDIFIARGDTWSREQMRQREAKQLIEGDDSTFRQIANAETIKLWWFRRGGEISQKQWDDIIGVLQVRSDTLDYDYLQVWAAELGVSDLLKKSFTDAKITPSIPLPPDTHTA